MLPPIATRANVLLRIRSFMRNPVRSLQANHQKYGSTYCFNLRKNRHLNIITADADLIQQVLRKNAAHYEKVRVVADVLSPFAGTGLLTAPPETHTARRRMIQPGFHRTKIASLSGELCGLIDQEMQRLSSKDGGRVEVSSVMRQLVFKMMTLAIFGHDIKPEQEESLCKSIIDIHQFFIRLIRLPSLIKWYRISGKSKVMKTKAEGVRAEILQIIAKRRLNADHADSFDLLQTLLDARYEDDNSALTDAEIADECMTLYVAGHETATNVASWLFYVLARYPDVAQLFEAELATLPKGEVPTFDQIQGLEYMGKVINETMRYYPASWSTDRMVIATDTFEEFELPEGARMILHIYGLHHNPAYWPNPHVFDPERFSTEAKKERHPYAYLPFGAGSRMCIGRNLAILCIQTILVRYYTQYKFELHTPFVDIRPLVTLQPDRDMFGVIMNK
jgi:cytochrome P450